jgi:16S rRNA (cytidine1402-2'-O)-methyltransferase
MNGRLILCGTPIGNLEDLSPRALRVLGEADTVACEDTRRTRKLLAHGGVRARRLVSYHEGNERKRARELVDDISRGAVIVLVSDAGMPGLSDPGYRLVQSCVAAGLPIEVVPGPSAAISALALSGLPPGRFAFEGFLPRKAGERRRKIAEISDDRRTLVFYESPHRVEESLVDLLDGLDDRPACLARELTKLHEEVRRGSLSELLSGVRADPPRGEIVLVVGGAIHAHKNPVAADELAGRAQALMDQGMDRKAALAEVARAAGVPRRAVFDALVRARGES